MIPLRGSALATDLAGPLPYALWPIGGPATPDADRHRHATVDPDDAATFGLRLVKGTHASSARPTIHLPTELNHLDEGDVISLTPDGTQIRVLWRAKSRQNNVLLTERCDNYCLMCSQPPKDGDDTWLLRQANELIDLLPQDTTGIGFTGGEPTLYGDGLIDLLVHCSAELPAADVHVLSNGRRFSDAAFADDYATIGNRRLMVGIPLYGSEPALHDYVVQADGAFDETVRGILNLAARDQRIELRIVVHQQTLPALVEIAAFIARNLPFVEQVALMGLELMGLARPNLQLLWSDPYDYRSTLTDAALLLDSHGIRTMIYNHQLCVLDPEVWHLAVPSISDWKNDYLATCEPCAVRDRCGGFFTSSTLKRSASIRAIGTDEIGPSASAGEAPRGLQVLRARQ